MKDHFSDKFEGPVGFNQISIECKSTMDLAGTSFGDEMMDTLSNLEALEVLCLRENPVTDEGIKQLNGSPALTHLDLAYTNVKLPGNEWGIGRFPMLPELTFLDLSYSLVNNVSIFKQLRYKTPKLTSLNMERVKVSPMWHSEYLSEFPPQLKHLYLSGIPISTHALNALLKYECLELLALKSCQLDAEHLSTLAKFNTLKVLQINDNRITQQQMKELRQSLVQGENRCIVN